MGHLGAPLPSRDEDFSPHHQTILGRRLQDDSPMFLPLSPAPFHGLRVTGLSLFICNMILLILWQNRCCIPKKEETVPPPNCAPDAPSVGINRSDSGYLSSAAGVDEMLDLAKAVASKSTRSKKTLDEFDASTCTEQNSSNGSSSRDSADILKTHSGNSQNTHSSVHSGGLRKAQVVHTFSGIETIALAKKNPNQQQPSGESIREFTQTTIGRKDAEEKQEEVPEIV